MSAHLLPLPSSQSIKQISSWCADSSMAAWLSFEAKLSAKALVYQLKFAERHIGNNLSRTLHGGVVSSFLQYCAQAEIYGRLPTVQSRVVSIHCNYLRRASADDIHGAVTVMQKGKRLVFLDAVGWQAEKDAPVARASVAIRLLSSDTP